MDNNEYLKYIYQEDLFMINEPQELNEGIAENADSEQPMQEEFVEKVNETPVVKFLGSNNKGILILVSDTENDFLNQHKLGFLMKIIESGLKYSKSDIALVNCLRFPYHQIFDEVHHTSIIAFGPHKTELLDGQPKYQVVDHDGIKIIVADDLGEIENDREKKMQLWKALQRMFEL